jgi:hypothetical protein
MTTLKGKYVHDEGRLVPSGEMKIIEEKLRLMKLCLDSGPGNYGSFYYDPATNNYWHCIQNEHYETELRIINREEASKKFPTVNFDRLLDIKRG